MPNSEVIIVTGGAGYIGSHVCKALAQSGYLPVTIDNLSMGHRWAVKWGPLEEGNLLDASFLNKAFSHYNPIAVIHLAAYAYVGESVLSPAKYYENNVLGSYVLLEAMRKCKIDKIVFSSSCATFGSPEGDLISENQTQKPSNPYGMTKLIVERMLHDYESAYALQHVSLRYFNAAGADPESRIGEAHNPETHLIPLTIDVALGRSETITIFGTDYDTADGTCIRDYVHVEDLASAHVLALDWLLSGNKPQNFNLGNGQGYSVLQIIKSVERVSGGKISLSEASRRPGDPPKLICDPTNAIDILRWKPRKTDIDIIVADALRWAEKDSNTS
jgi:UDP-arabinose 4-epimerase